MGSGNKQNSTGWNDLATVFRKAAPYINVTYILISSIILFGLVGWWIDRTVHMEPLFFIIGLFVGLGVGFYSLFKALQKLDKDQ